MSGNRKKISNAFDLLQDESEASQDDDNKSPSQPSMTDFDASVYGAVRAADANRQKAEPISIFDIHPDPAQPRRAIPAKVRKLVDWQGQPEDMDGLFQTWEDLINAERDERQAALKLSRLLDEATISISDEKALQSTSDTDDDDDVTTAIGPLEHALRELVQLAVSIRHEGLTNPITVVPAGRHYRLETGERRWLAYHLLYAHTGDEKFGKIAARTVESFSIWRQAAENNARQNLNAVSIARQLAVLLMDLRRDEADDSYRPFEDFEHEQSYYAQVADGNAHRIPRGNSERLLNATGLKSPKQLREYRRILRLPHLVWEIADDLNWAERAIRDLHKRAINEDDLIVLAARKARKEGYTVPMGTVPNKRPKDASKAKQTDSAPPAPGTSQYYSHLVKMLNDTKRGKGDKQATMEMIQEFRHWLDEQETQIDQIDDG